MRHLLPIFTLLAASSGYAMPMKDDLTSSTLVNRIDIPYLPRSNADKDSFSTKADIIFPNLPKVNSEVSLDTTIQAAYAYLLTVWGLATETLIRKTHNEYKETHELGLMIKAYSVSGLRERYCNHLFPPAPKGRRRIWKADPLYVDNDSSGLLFRICESFKGQNLKLSAQLERASPISAAQWDHSVNLFHQESILSKDIINGNLSAERFFKEDDKIHLKTESLQEQLITAIPSKKPRTPGPVSSVFLRAVIKAFISSMVYNPFHEAHKSSVDHENVRRMKQMALTSHLRFWKTSFPKASFDPVFKAILARTNGGKDTTPRPPVMMDVSKAIYKSSSPVRSILEKIKQTHRSISGPLTRPASHQSSPPASVKNDNPISGPLELSTSRQSSPPASVKDDNFISSPPQFSVSRQSSPLARSTNRATQQIPRFRPNKSDYDFTSISLLGVSTSDLANGHSPLIGSIRDKVRNVPSSLESPQHLKLRAVAPERVPELCSDKRKVNLIEKRRSARFTHPFDLTRWMIILIGNS
ncbi:hypothetical protein BJ684DRAFT_14883 [Piptocephalis cylindrospora]|uniref:Uncharacterized protein n=1 Tax=Piptocephalis cylindrospora TaxID=1907219 RepID=A0A4P9Y739_9FUNG|nr:hypothetical protein BJ684DRAFT_14883 [Piptocephalis cylindrospora]|eukprot:RKP14813.1 hypothetical protein BJ684DRAFT_14883 [Piptocephalis cylindrospora]